MNEPQLVAALRAAGCVFAEDEARLLIDEAPSPGELMAWAARRMAGEPLEQVVGWAAFAGVRVAVEPGVFVPRRRSELLVTVAGREPAGSSSTCAAARRRWEPRCTRLWPTAEIHAADSTRQRWSAPAATCRPSGSTRATSTRRCPTICTGRVDLVVANAPYVPTDAIATMPREARDHEHRVALDGGLDGLDVHRRVAAGAPSWLRPGGRLVVETGRDQADVMAAVVTAAGMAAQVETDDDLGATVVLGRV